jgi:hypothetical protein
VSVDENRRVFCENFNMEFRLPKIDTCKICDKFSVHMQPVAQEDKLNLERQWNEHKQKANDLILCVTVQSMLGPVDVHIICLIFNRLYHHKVIFKPRILQKEALDIQFLHTQHRIRYSVNDFMA